MNEQVQSIIQKLESWFFWFWVARWKFTALFSLLLIGIGLYSAFIIPKESSPEIEFGIIQVTTIYPGVNPLDMDTLVTEKIEQSLEGIEWVKKITSTSAIGVANTIIELTNDADTSKALVDIKDAVDKTQLPSDAEDSIVTEISIDNERMFNVLLYGPADIFTQAYLRERAQFIKVDLENKWLVSRVDIEGGTDYEVRVVVDQAKTNQLGIRITDVANAIRANNNNQPLGNHRIDTLNYTFRIQGEWTNEQDILLTRIVTPKGVIELSSIATVQRHYTDERVARLGKYQASGYNFITMTFNKKAGDNIFTSSDKAKKWLMKLLNTQLFQWLAVAYTQDLADIIRDDYQSLASNGLQTVFFVFFAILLFVGLKESIIASITIPLAFLITFIVLNQLWLSLNFLTNFSLIICFGIAIDTTIVVIEWAHEKMKIGFGPKSAVLLAVKEYKRPLIAGTATTCVVFLPLLSLPGVTGKFLAYIPITIFTTLLAALFISLTINSALYYKLNKKNIFYQKREDEKEYLTDEELTLLAVEREGKQQKTSETFSRREKILNVMGNKYGIWLSKIMNNKKSRLTAIVWPVILLLLSFVLISPRLWFEFFPRSDSSFINVSIIAREWTVTDTMTAHMEAIDAVMTQIPEIQTYSYTINNNNIRLLVELFNKDERKKRKLRNSFAIETEITQLLAPLTTQWLQVSTSVQAWWPPVGRPVGIRLVANSNETFAALMDVARDFQNHLQTIPGARNVTNSSSESPWQFVFTIDKNKLALMGLLPNEVMTELFLQLNGMGAGSIRGRFDTYDIKIMYDRFIDEVSANDIMNISIPTRAGNLLIGTIANYNFESAISSVTREDGNITVRVESDVDQWLTPDAVQSQLITFAQSYNFPDGISFQEAGETQENADIIQATGVAFVIAIVLIYAILILQFNSFLQPFIIMYSIVMGLLGSNIGLRITGNPYSMAFGIWFIALTGIVVNDAIVFIDRANNNIARWLSRYDAIIETGRARLQPIILTTITTVLWLSSVARQDEFFAGLAYTIMFWLAVASAMTLFVIPALYYDQAKIVHNVKRSIIAGIIFIAPLIGMVLAIYIIWLMLSLGFITKNIGIVFGMLFVVYLISYIVYSIQSYTMKEANIIEQTIGLQVVMDDGAPLTKKLAIKRFAYKRWSLLLPTILGSIISPILGALLLFIMLGINFVYVWLDDDNKTLYDRRTGTKTINL
jgi:multidrug efflux pump